MPSEFEQMFSSLAYSFLQKTGLDLSRYLIGFDIVDKNEQQSRGIGLFALKINDDYFYAPVFYLAGEVKPLMLLYDYKKNLFMPLSQEWVEFLEKDSMPRIGEAHEPIVPPAQPLNIREFMQPPFINKISSDKHGQALAAFAKMQKNSSETGGMLLYGFLEETHPVVKSAFIQAMKDNVNLLRNVMQVYDFGQIKAACSSKRPLGKVASFPRVHLITDQGDASALSNKDKAVFLKQGYVIADSRPKNSICDAYEINYSGAFTSPEETGIYELWTNHGKERCFVGIAPMNLVTGSRSKDNHVICMDTKDWTCTEMHQLAVLEEDSPGFAAIDPSEFKDIGQMKIGKTYILFNTGHSRGKTGCTSLPVTIEQKTKGADGNIYFVGTQGCDRVSIVVKESGNMSRLGADTVVPKSFKAIELGDCKLELLSKPDLVYRLYENHYEYKLANLALFRNGEMIEKFAGDMEAEYALVSRYNLAVSDAKRLVQGEYPLFVEKRAVSGFLPQAGNPGYASFLVANNAPGGVTEPNYTAYTARQNGYRSGLVNAYQEGPKRPTIQDEINKAVELSEMGMKDVFDKAVLGILSKMNDVESEISSYIPAIMKAIDKLGRYLFLLWYAGPKIKDRYGLNEYAETEDKLKEHFKGLGEIVLDMKQKFSPASVI